MRFTVLGSGSAGNCYLLEGRKSALILECGIRPAVVFGKYGIVPSKVIGCVVSHEHHDHAGFMKRYADMGLTIYASGGTLVNSGQLDRTARVVRLEPMMVTQAGEFRISPFRVEHDATEPLGFIIEHPEAGRILFVTDTIAVRYNFRSQRLDHILVEANYDDDILDGRTLSGELSPERATRVRRTHMSIRTACELIRANETSALKTVTLIHLSDENSNAENFALMASKAARFARIRVAAAGTSFDMSINEI